MKRGLALLSFLVWCAAAMAQQATEFVFEGNETYTRAQLIHALNRYEIDLTPPIEPTTADDAAYFLREFLFEQGLPEADVEYRFAGATVFFTISEGPKYLFGKVTFSGGEAITSERMEDIFTAEMRQATRNPFGALRYVQSATESAADRIRQALVQDGFLSASVQVKPDFEDRMVNVSVTATPGPQSVVEEAVVESSSELPEKVHEIARRAQGGVYHPGQELTIRSQVHDYLRANGYFNATVTQQTTFDATTGGVRIVIAVQPGGQFRMGTIGVTGNRRTLTTAILQRLGVKAGTTYDAATVDAGIRRLWFTGAFSDVDARQTPTSDGTVNMVVKVAETAAKQLTTTLGYGQWQRGFADATYTDRNFLGTLNRFSLRGNISTKNYGIQAALSDPFFLRTPVIATVSGFAQREETPAFKVSQYGGGFNVERQYDQNNLTGWRAGYQWKAVTNTVIYADEANDVLDDYTLGAVSFEQTLDRRNDLLSPTKGYFLNWQGDVASRYLAGEVSFLRLSVQATWYIPFRKITPERPFVPFLILNHRAGLMAPYDNDTTAPIPERFFLGGPDTVRSFQLDGLGPKDQNGYPVGGMAYLLGNAEIQWPIWRALYVAGFVDVGNLSPSLESLSWSYTRIGPGLGARLYTPIGALRVDYGYNLIRKEGDPVGAWQFGFGFTF